MTDCDGENHLCDFFANTFWRHYTVTVALLHCTIFTVAKDSPDGFEVAVQRCKKGATIDANCFYTLRGSFTGVKQHALKEAMDQHEAVVEKLLGMVAKKSDSIWKILNSEYSKQILNIGCLKIFV